MCFFNMKKEVQTRNIISHDMWYMRLENLLIDHFNEIGAANMEIAYKMHDNVLTIYTRSPGLLIGPKGIYSSKLKEKLQQHLHNDNVVVEHVQITNVLPMKKWTDSEILKTDENIFAAYASEF